MQTIADEWEALFKDILLQIDVKAFCVLIALFAYSVERAYGMLADPRLHNAEKLISLCALAPVLL